MANGIMEKEQGGLMNDLLMNIQYIEWSKFVCNISILLEIS
jgi:hypothetical protein